MDVVRILRIVVASPGDVQAERDLLEEVVAELNQGFAADRGLRLEVVRWETDAYPGFHVKGPQGLIDPILNIKDSDILIGIFWKRFGTPTKDTESGTEHKIRIAYEAWKKDQHPQIMVYFNQEPYTPKSITELDQWRQVLKFKSEFPEEGLRWDYDGPDAFVDLVRTHLINYLRHYQYIEDALPDQIAQVRSASKIIGPQIEYITGLELENIRSFKRLKLDFSDGDGPRMLSVIIGRNGTCKSTLLRCIALILCDESDAGALLASTNSQLISEGQREGQIVLHTASADGEKRGIINLSLRNKDGKEIIGGRRIVGSKIDFFACGYGAGRGLVGATQSHGYRTMDAVESLFDYQHILVDPELMLRRLEDFLGTQRYEHAMKGVKRVLGLGPDDHIEYARGGGVRISGPGIGEDIPLDGWADGYRLTFNWMIDLYGWAMQAEAVTETGGVQGILLLDEIEQHLHPSMQAELLSVLREALPKMQVFATTHSPLVALGTKAESLIALHRTGSEVYVASVPSLEGYSAEDALVEEALFGTDPYPRSTRDDLNRHRELSAIPSDQRTEQQTRELKELAAKLDPAKLPDLRDDPIVQKLDQLTALLSQEDDT